MNTPASIHNEAELWAAAASTGGLNEAELRAWNDHIAACPACKQLNQEELAMARLIKQTLDTHSPDPGFEQRILRKLNEAHPTNRNRWYEYLLFHPGLAAAAACLALVAVIGIGSLVHAGKQTALSSAVPGVLDGLPIAVRDAIQHQAEGKTIASIQPEVEDGETIYDVVTKTQDGGEIDFTVTGDGTLLDVDTALAEVPQDVQDAIKTQTGQGRLEGIDKTFDNGETEYVATITSPDGHQHDFTFAQDGILREVEAPLAELPAPIQSAINAQAGKGRLEGVVKSFENNETEYVATITSPDGRERDFTFSADGTLSSMEITRDELPAAVQTAIQGLLGGGSLDGLDKTFDSDGITYDASMIGTDGRRRNISLSEQGKLLSREVAMNEAPKAVQQTISRTLGKGKIIEIDQAFDEPNNIIPYEIEALKDGKPVNFIVSPTGDLLGMEN